MALFLEVTGLTKQQLEDCGCEPITGEPNTDTFIVKVPDDEAMAKLDVYWMNPAIWGPPDTKDLLSMEEGNG